MEAEPPMLTDLNFSKLIGAENYKSWKSNMKTFLQNENLHKTIILDNEGNVMEKDEDKLLKAKVFIDVMLSEDIRILVGNLSSALDLWLKLKSLCQDKPNGLCKQLHRLKKLFSINKLDDCVSMDDYLNKIANFVTELEIVNYKLDDEFVGQLMLSGLSADYDVLVRRMEYSGMKITAETVKRKLMVDVAKKDALLVSRTNQLPDQCLYCKFELPNSKKLKGDLVMTKSTWFRSNETDTEIEDKEKETEDEEEETELLVDNYVENIFSPVASIDVLNDDCLLNIFQYLPRIDAIKMERVCKRWERISVESWKTVRTIYVMEEFKYQPISVKSVEEVLRRGGEFITELYFVGIKNSDLPARAFMELISKYCKKLTVLHLHYTTWKDKNYLGILDKSILSNLKSLSVGNHYDFSDENLTDVLEQAVNLEEFGVYNYAYLGGYHPDMLNLSQKCKKLRVCSDFHYFGRDYLKDILQTHPNIQTLDLSASKLIYHIHEILPFGKQLTHLSLININQSYSAGYFGPEYELPLFPNLKTLQLRYKDNCLKALLFFVENCPELEDLRIKDVQDFKAEDFKHVKNLKKLKYLDVSNTKISNSVLADIANELGKLRIVSCHGCRNVTSTGLTEIIEASPQLSYLAITSSTFSKELVQSALSSLQKRGNNVSLTISLRSKTDNKIPDFVEELDLNTGINYHSKTNILNIGCKSNTCFCKVDETCKCSYLDKILKRFG